MEKTKVEQLRNISLSDNTVPLSVNNMGTCKSLT